MSWAEDKARGAQTAIHYRKSHHKVRQCECGIYIPYRKHRCNECTEKRRQERKKGFLLPKMG